jgi:RNA polymerase sigma factor (sigma-70 family)
MSVIAAFTHLDAATDGQLLGRFVQARDTDAFAALVRRLGPTVLAVCRRTCPDAHLAEDAFQAAFLVLATKAESVRPREQVAAWLYGVAYRTASKARAMLASRRRRETDSPELPEPSQPEACESNDDADLRRLDAAIAGLPEHLRAAVVLCELEGRPRKDAAAALGIPIGTLSSRLADARKRLGERLRPAAAVVSAALAASTAEAVLGGSTSETVKSLARGVMSMMLLQKFRLPAAVLLAVALFSGVAFAMTPGERTPERAEPPKAEAKDDKPVEYTLDNGLRVRLVPRAGDKQVMVLLFARAGFLQEPAGLPHVAHITEHLTVFDLPPAEAKLADGWFKDGKANGETLPDLMYFDLLVPSDEAEAAVKVQAARLAGAEFSKETLVREVPRALQEVDFVEKSKFPAAGKFAFAPFTQAALHGKTDQPLRARTKKLTVADVTAFHRQTFRPDGAGLVVAGEFDPKAIRKTVDAAYGEMKNQTPPIARPVLSPGELSADWDVDTRHLFVAWSVPDPSHADHPALTFAALALMEKFMTDNKFNKQAMLFPTLNDTEGLFVVGAQAIGDTELKDVKVAFLERVAALADAKAWTANDLERMRKRLDQFVAPDTDLDALKSPARYTRTMALGQMELTRMTKTLAWGDLDVYRKRLAAVKPEEVAAAVAKHLPEKGATVVRVEKAKK